MQKNTNSANKKFWEKIASEKSAKNVFYIHPKVVTKTIGKKTRETIFPETHELCDEKMLGKNRRKKCQKTFLIFTRSSSPKNGGEISAKQFFQKQTNCARKKLLGKKSSEKRAKQRFLYLHEYREKKWGEKTRETIFTEEHE